MCLPQATVPVSAGDSSRRLLPALWLRAKYSGGQFLDAYGAQLGLHTCVSPTRPAATDLGGCPALPQVISVEYRKLSDAMVDTQLVPRGIQDRRVLDAMRRVPRHLFAGGAHIRDAYADMALPIGEGQTISQPYMVAIMTELLDLAGTEKVLEIGTGSGYQAAVIAELAASVFTIERIASLAERSRLIFGTLSYETIRVRVGDGTLGWPDEAPFDRIITTAASPDVPGPLLEQLAINGKLVIPVGSRYSQQILRITKTADGLREERHTPCVFVPLIGKHGWPPEKP